MNSTLIVKREANKIIQRQSLNLFDDYIIKYLDGRRQGSNERARILDNMHQKDLNEFQKSLDTYPKCSYAIEYQARIDLMRVILILNRLN